MSDTYTPFAPIRYDESAVARQGYGSAASGPTDDKLIVGFYVKSVLNQHKSREAGKRIYESSDFIKIQKPGETLEIVDRPVKDDDKRRFPRQWQQFSEGRKQIPDGIPISLLFPHEPTISDTLAGYNIHTVEQLSSLSAHGITTVGLGAQEWVNKAKKYLDQATKGVDFHRFNKALEEKDRQIETLNRQVQEMSATVQRFMAAQTPQQPPQNFDLQQSMIDNTMQPQTVLPPAQFRNDFSAPDLSAETQARKPGWPKGKKRGPRQPKEI